MSSEPRVDPVHRPQYHFLPAGNWMNDPNGLIQWQGRYHLFYQYNPYGPFHGTIHWGHAASDDLVHWEHLPVALAPTAGSVDAEGCWSGCAVDAEGVPMILYTATSPQTVAVATGDGELIHWEKREGNPVIAAPPAEVDAGDPADFRDPFVWREDGEWRMVIGSLQVGEGGLALLYRSPDLLQWEYVGPLLRGDLSQQEPFWTGDMWECPNFFPLAGAGGEQHVLIISVADTEGRKVLYPAYFSGRYEDDCFHPEQQAILEYGGHFYAPQVMQDEQGRWLIWGWIWEGRSLAAQKKAGWAGVMSLPRVLSLAPGGRVEMTPALELQALRGAHMRVENVRVPPDGGAGSAEVGSNALGDVAGAALEIDLTFAPNGATRFGIALRRSPGGEEKTRVVYDVERQALTVEREHASHDEEAHRRLPEPHRPVEHAPLPLARGDRLRLHIFLDHSVLEIFATAQREGGNEETVTYATRIYPTRRDAIGLQLFAEGGAATAERVDVWEMADIWAEM